MKTIIEKVNWVLIGVASVIFVGWVVFFWWSINQIIKLVQ